MGLRKCSTPPRPAFAPLGVDGESVERSFPELAVLLEPRLDDAEGVGVQDAAVDSAVDVTNDQSRMLEHLEVSRDRGERDREWLGELGDGRRAPCEARRAFAGDVSTR